MDIFQTILLILVALAVVLYATLTEGLDWIGRAELIQQKFPLLWGAMNNRPMRIILLLVAVVMLAHITSDLRAGAEAPLIRFASTEVPKIDNNLKVITVGTPQKQQCWTSSQHFGLPNPAVAGAKSATAAIMHCNYLVRAPLEVVIVFDQDFIGGSIMPIDSGMATISTTREGKAFIGRITSPSLLSDQLVIVTVYGTTSQFPRVVKSGIRTIK